MDTSLIRCDLSLVDRLLHTQEATIFARDANFIDCQQSLSGFIVERASERLRARAITAPPVITQTHIMTVSIYRTRQNSPTSQYVLFNKLSNIEPPPRRCTTARWMRFRICIMLRIFNQADCDIHMKKAVLYIETITQYVNVCTSVNKASKRHHFEQ